MVGDFGFKSDDSATGEQPRVAYQDQCSVIFENVTLGSASARTKDRHHEYMYVMELIPLRNEWSRFGAIVTPHADRIFD